MKKLFVFLAFTFAFIGAVGAQPAGQLQPGQVWGNPTNAARTATGAAVGAYQFTEPGSGALTRTWQAKVQETRSLTDFAKCDGATDDSAAIQSAIASLPTTGGTIYMPQTGTCVHLSTITQGGRSNVVFKGSGNITSTTGASVFIYGGTGTRGWDLRDSSGWTFDGVQVLANQAAFSGTIIDAGGNSAVSAFFKFTNGYIGGQNSATPTCINVSNSIEFEVSNTNLAGCTIAIRGQQVLGQSTVGFIDRNQFVANTTAISDCGESWSITRNTFEGTTSNPATSNAQALTVNSARPCKNLIYQGNWHGDTTSSGTWLTLSANGASITGNRISNGAVGIAMTGGAGYSIRNNNMESTTAFSCTSSPTGGEIASNVYSSTTTYLSGTCVNFNIQGISATTLVSQQVFVNGTSGSITLTPDTGALSSAVATLKAGTYDIVGNSLTQTLTNKSIPSFDGGSAAGSTVTINGTSNGSPSSAYVNIQTNGQRVGMGGQTAPQTLLHVGAGNDAPNLSSAQLYVSAAGTSAFAVRDSTNDIEFGMFTNHTPDVVVLGSRTNHPVVIQTNSNNNAAFSASGGLTLGSALTPLSATPADGVLQTSSYIAAGTKIRAAGTAPTITAGCNGAGSSIVGSDLAGTVTGQTSAATSCTITFNSAYAATPHCVASGQSSPLTTTITPSTTTLVVNFTSTANFKWSYICMAQSGG